MQIPKWAKPEIGIAVLAACCLLFGMMGCRSASSRPKQSAPPVAANTAPAPAESSSISRPAMNVAATPPTASLPTGTPSKAIAGPTSLQFVKAPPINAAMTVPTQLPPRGATVASFDEEEPIPSPPGDLPSAVATQLTLPTAIETSLRQNPDLIALRQTQGVSSAVVGVARSFPFNPFFQFQATPWEQAPASALSQEPNAAQKIFQYYLVMQTFELAHQRRHRTAAAMAQLSSVRWNVFQAELQNIALTEQLYMAALYQRGLRDLAQAGAKLSGSLLAVMERQLAAGQASAADTATTRIDARATRQQARLAEANYQTALLALRRQLNLSTDSKLELAGDLGDLEWLPVNAEHLSQVPSLARSISPDDSYEKLVGELASGRPDVMSARSLTAAAAANRNLARANRVPNLIAGPYYQSDDFGIKYFGFRGQVDIPIANTGRPLLNQRTAELRLQQVTAQQLRRRAEQEVRAALERYERARQLAADAAADLGEGMPIEIQRLEQQFEAGEVDMMRIFTARSSLLQLRRAYLDSLNELALAAAGVTAATGLPPDALIRIRPTPLPPPLPPLAPVGEK